MRQKFNRSPETRGGIHNAVISQRFHLFNSLYLITILFYLMIQIIFVFLISTEIQTE